MDPTPDKLLWLLLIVAIAGWLVFNFSAKVVGLILKKVLGLVVLRFRLASLGCVKDVSVQFKRGGVASISIGELRLRRHKRGLQRLWDWRLQLSVGDIEVVMRSSQTVKKTTGKSSTRRKSSSGRTMLMVVAKIANFINVSLTDIVIRASEEPKVSVEIKDVGLDLCKEDGAVVSVEVKLVVVPLHVYLGDKHVVTDPSLLADGAVGNDGHQAPVACIPPLFTLESTLVKSSLYYDSEAGISVRQLEVICGNAILHLEEANLLGLLSLRGRKSLAKPHGTVAVSELGDGGKAGDPVQGTESKKGLAGSPAQRRAIVLPESLRFDLSMLCVNFSQKESALILENRVMGIQLQGMRCPSALDGQKSQLDVQVDVGGVYLLRGKQKALLEILKVAVAGCLEVPSAVQEPVKLELDVKLGGLQLNMFLTTIMQCLKFGTGLLSKGQRSPEVVSADHSLPTNEVLKSKLTRKFVWGCSFSAPELAMTVSGSDDSQIFQCSSQTAHLYLNKMTSKGLRCHCELGEIQITSVEYVTSRLRSCLPAEGENDCCWMRLSHLEVEWGVTESDPNAKLMVIVKSRVCALFVTLDRLQTILLCSSDFERSLKQVVSAMRKSRPKSRGTVGPHRRSGLRKVNFILDGFALHFSEPHQVHSTQVLDPKKFNYGEPLGQIIITKMPDGRPREARVFAELNGSEESMINCRVLAEITSFEFCLDKDAESIMVHIIRGRLDYQELQPEASPPVHVVTLVSADEASLSLTQGNQAQLTGSKVTCCWTPDVHLFGGQVLLDVKNLLDLRKRIGVRVGAYPVEPKAVGEISVDMAGKTNENISEVDKRGKPKLRLSLGIEGVGLTADLADGVMLKVHADTLLSENAEIEVSMGNVEARFNKSKVLGACSLKISRIPFMSSEACVPTAGIVAVVQTRREWEWVVQGRGVRLTLAYGLQLRAIEDAVEDMWRGLKLALAAQKSRIRPGQPSQLPKQKAGGSVSVAAIRFVMDDILAEIEDEPLQGWLDEHYRIMLKVVRERLLREHILEERSKESERKQIQKLGLEVESDSVERGSSSLRGAVGGQGTGSPEWEAMHREMFRTYYKECTDLIPDEGSGACQHGRQSGFKPSTDRASLMSVRATTFKFLLTNIPGGRHGMLHRIRELDCVSPDLHVPFSTMYGYHVNIDATSLVLRLRNYTLPMLSAISGKAAGDVILAKQGTVFPKQVEQELYIGQWRRIRMLRSISGSSPPLKMYSELRIELNYGRVCYGVGFEPALADVSYALSIAMKKANLSLRKLDNVAPVKKERSLPWWDDMRYYIHGKNSIAVTDFRWNCLATTDPYENTEMLVFASKSMTFMQTEGSVSAYGKEFALIINQEGGTLNQIGCKQKRVFLRAPIFELDVKIEWESDSGEPLQHYLHALPGELDAREKVYDPFRSYFLALGWTFRFKEHYARFSGEDPPGSCAFHVGSFRKVNDLHVGTARKDTLLRVPKDVQSLLALEKLEDSFVMSVPIMHLSAYNLMWIFKWWNLVYSPPHKLRSFSKWPRFGVPRVARSGNLSLDKVLCEFLLRVDSKPACVEHASLGDDDPADGLAFNTTSLKYEIFYSRAFHRQHPERRDLLEVAYQGLDIHMLKVKLDRSPAASVSEEALLQAIKKAARVNYLVGLQEVSSDDIFRGLGIDNASDDGFLLSTDHFRTRRETPKADAGRLAWWQVGDRHRSNGFSHNGAGHSSEPTSDDEGFDVVVPDNCLRVSVYELKLLWTIGNRDAVWAWVGEISKAFESHKPSPSRQYAQRKKLEGAHRTKIEDLLQRQPDEADMVPRTDMDVSPPVSSKLEQSVVSTPKVEEEKLHFMVNVVHPQFNLQSEDAKGRFLLAAASGRVLARSFTVHSAYKLMEGVLKNDIPSSGPDSMIPWKRRELSVWLERVHAHVAPCDVDLGAGIQWLPKIPTRTITDRTGPLLERVFMPCSMYFQYTRHKGDTPDWKAKSLKELSFNSSNIIANMSSRHFEVMVDIIGNLLLARLPKPRKNSFLHPDEEDEDDDTEEEADEVVPEGVEEVELARIRLEHIERKCHLVFDDIRAIKQRRGSEEEGESEDLDALVEKLELDHAGKCKARRAARTSLRTALQRAAQQRLMEKEKNKAPSAAMSISWVIDQVVWSMLRDGRAFAEAEISDMILHVDRDFNDHGVALFSMKSFIVRDCLPNVKSNMTHASLLSAWNPPADWGRNCMLRVFAKQGVPKDGHSPLELFEVDVFPLKIHLTEAMYRMMWAYFFPEDDQNSQERQEARRLSAISVSKRVKSTAPSIGDKVPEAQGESLARSGSGMQNTQSGLLEHLSAREAYCVSIDQPSEVSRLLVGRGSARLKEKETEKEVEKEKERQKEKEKDSRRSSRDNKSLSLEEKDARGARKSFLEFHNIKISQVELIVTYEGRLHVNDLRLLMDAFARPEFTGSWRRLFAQVKKHIIWSVLKSVTGMQGKKFKDKLPAQDQVDSGRYEVSDSNSSDSGGSNLKDIYSLTQHKRHSDRAGAAFVSSVKGLFNTQRKKAVALVRRPIPGDGDLQGDWSEGEAENISKHGSMSKAKQLFRTHANKLPFLPSRRQAKKLRSTIRIHGVTNFGDRLHVASSHPSSDEESDGSSTYENPME